MSEYDCATTTAELASVLDDLRTLPFLSERRLVLVREADKFISLYREAVSRIMPRAPAPPASCSW